MANPLGFARGKHKLGVFLFSLVNLDASVRTTPGYIQVAGIVLESDVKKFGPLVCFAGVDPQTRQPNPKLWATPSAQLRALHEGVQMNLPMNSNPTPVHAWMVLFIADMLAMHKLNPFVESPSAYCPCRECNWDTRCHQAYKPVGFLREGDSCRWQLYDTDSLEPVLADLRGPGAQNAKKDRMQDMGLNAVDHALSPDYNPHFRFVEMCPQVSLAHAPHCVGARAVPVQRFRPLILSPLSVCCQEEMHGEDDGLLRGEGYQVIYIANRKWKLFTLDNFNARLADWNWQGTIVQPLHPSVCEGTKGGKPSPGAHLRYSASQTVAFALALEHIMAPLVEDTQEPAWLSWLAHAHYFRLKMARAFTDASILELEDAVIAHQVHACPLYLLCIYMNNSTAISYLVCVCAWPRACARDRVGCRAMLLRCVSGSVRRRA